MHILVTNDDGPPSNQSSPYIHSFVKTLQSAGHTVSVVLPHQQRSWIGKAHFASQVVKPTYFRPGTLHADDGTTHAKPLHSDSSNNSEEWILVDSTPATAAQLGLFHFFQDKGPVDLVVSGPNYGRNTTSLFSLSSGTIGGAMEAAVCRKRAIALSFAFFSRNHDPEIIAGASRTSVKVVEHLMQHWDEGVDLYSVNVPLIDGVEERKVMYTYALQNYWQSGSSFTETEADDEAEDPDETEARIRVQEGMSQVGGSEGKATRHKHRHFKWTPNFSDVYQSVEASKQGNDGWAVKEGLVSVTPLKANFMHVPGLQGELKLSMKANMGNPKFYAQIDWQDTYTHPIIMEAFSAIIPSFFYTLIDSIEELPAPETPFLQITSYETLAFEHLLEHPKTSIACSYIIRKALIRKHYLSHTIHSYLTKHPESRPKLLAPLTVDFEVDYAEFLDEALVEAYELHDAFARNEGKAVNDREWWILKPSMSDRGQGIRLFSTESELHDIFQRWEQDQSDSEDEDKDGGAEAQESPSDEGGPECGPALESKSRPDENEKPTNGVITSQLRHFVAQLYIPPLILPEYGNRKFHIRTYVLCVGALHVYVYKEMLALFAAVSYQAPGTPSPKAPDTSSERSETPTGGIDMLPHLTNTCLQSSASNSNPKVLPLHLLCGAVLTPSALSSIQNQICTATCHVFRAAVAQPTTFQPLPNAFEIFGVDWLVDPGMKVHLLEFNAYPDFGQSGEDGKKVVEGLWRGVFGIVLNGDAEGGKGLFGDLEVGETNRSERKGAAEQWGMEKVLDLDMGRR